MASVVARPFKAVSLKSHLRPVVINVIPSEGPLRAVVEGSRLTEGEGLGSLL